MRSSWRNSGSYLLNEEGQPLLEGRNGWRECCQCFVDKKCATTIFYSVILIMLVVVERFTFKVMVDRMAPFRFVLVQAVALCYFVFVGVVLIYKAKRRELSNHMEGLPKWKLAVMAVLDLCHLIPMIVSATEVAPTLTVLLLQCSRPICQVVSYIFKLRSYSFSSVLGAVVIVVGTGVASFLPVYNLFLAWSPEGLEELFKDDDLRQMNATHAEVEGLNTLMYLLACLPAALSTYFKQRVLENYGLPVDSHQLNLAVLLFEFLFLLLISPLSFQLQNLGYHHFMKSLLGSSLQEGWRCWLLMKPVEDPNRYPLEAQCEGGLPLVMAYVMATLLVSHFVQKVVDAAESTAAYYHTMTLSVPTAFLALALYQKQKWAHEDVNVFTMASLVVIIIGLQLYRAGSQHEESESMAFTVVKPPSEEEEDQIRFET